MKSARSKKSKPYLQNRGGIFYFRIAYPQILVNALGLRQGEFKISLKTFDPREAQRISYYLSDEVDQFFTEIAFRAMNMHHDEIKNLIRGYFEKKLLDYSERLIAARSLARTELNEFEPEYIESLERNAKSQMQRLHQMKQNYGAQHERTAQSIITQRGMNLNHTSDLFHELCYGLLRADIEVERIHYANLVGNYPEAKITDDMFAGCRNFFESPDPTLHFESYGQLSLEAGNSKKKAPMQRLHKAIQEYFSHREKEAKHQGQSQYKLREYKAFFVHLMEIWGEDKDITTLNKQDGLNLKKLMLAFPKRYKENFGKKEISLKDVLEQHEDYDIISPAQSKKMWSNYQQFFKWCIENELIKNSPLEGLEIKGRKHTIDDRHSFTQEQLQQLFACPIYTGRKYRSRSPWEAPDAGREGLTVKDAHYWVPLVGLYSGLRAGEILTLRVMDIRYHGETAYFDINCEAEGKTLKTAESHRQVPVHPELIRMGFIEYWQIQRNTRNQEDNLFEGVPIPKERPSNKYSNQFSELLKRIGIKTDKTSFHSFRHNFGDQLRRLNGVNEEMKDALDGRTSENRSGGNSRKNYGTRYTPTELLEVIRQVQYDIDLSHLYED